MSTTFAPQTTPYDDVVIITGTIGGKPVQGSGVLISPDEVLTAAHVVYQQGLGTISDIQVKPGNSAALGSYSSTSIHYNAVNDSGGVISGTDAQSDFAIIHLSHPVDGVGYMGIEAGYSLGGPGTTTGFPGAIFETNAGTAYPVSGINLLQIPYLGSGSSGGPCWTIGPDGTACVVSTVSFSDGSGSQYGPLYTFQDVSKIQSWLALDGETQAISNSGRTMVTTNLNGATAATFYEGILGRAPVPAEEVYYHHIIDSGAYSADQVASFFLSSPEYINAHPSGQSDAQFIDMLFSGMTGRAATHADELYYENILAAGASRGLVAAYCATSPEAQAHIQAWLMVL